jgi:hypothetical protein
MRMQIMDAFSRGSQKKVVTVIDKTPVSAVCYFGGAPRNIRLDTCNFQRLK